MEKNLYIDASHPNETRVVLKSDDNIEDYEYEGLKNNLIKNNIYLGKVSRIEPSLQAAFIDFGRERHGFLSFNDIQSDYYQIPKADLDKIKEEEEKAREELSKQVEAKEEEKIAEGKLEIDDPIEKELENQTGDKEIENEKNNADDEKEKPFSVYRTGAMVSHMVTAVNVGYQFMGFLVLFVLMAKQILGWSATALGWSFIAIPIVNTLVMYYVIPPLIKRFGVHALITYSSACTMLTLAVFAVPAVHTSPAGVMAVTVSLVLCVVTVQVPNQMRIKLIADAFAPGDMGKITGASRVCFAIGQTSSPVVCAVLYVIHPSLAIGSMFLAVTTVPIAFYLCGQSFFVDPATKESGEAQPNDAA